jgi:SagB-type dehydrogenase family enzyme
LDRSDQIKGLPHPRTELPASSKYIIELPDPKKFKANPVSVSEAINMRISIRAYSDESLNLDELSYLLWCTQGVKTVVTSSTTQRTFPSAGARHSFETYLLVNRVKGLQPGHYRFLAIDHKLQVVSFDSDINEKVTKACFNQRFIISSAVTFIWTSVRYRMMWRYGERGHRYIHLDAGHVCQNLYLAGESIDVGVCAIAAFFDDALNEALDIDGEEQFTIYIGVCGKKLHGRKFFDILSERWN